MNNKIERIKIAALCTTVVCVIGGSVAYFVNPASADGIPQDSPMTYAGVLEENGQLVHDTRNFRLTVYDDPASTSFENLKCSTQASGVAIEGGHFRVPLENSCTAAVHENPNLWVEVEVNGEVIGRTKMGAVPYALEAARASALVQDAQDLLVPPGTVIAFAGPIIPDGWLLCDGEILSRVGEYERLYAAIGTAHGDGDGSSTFHLPDYRGMFLRGVDHSAGADPGAGNRAAANVGGNENDRVGSVQGDTIGNHVHDMAHVHPMSHSHTMRHRHNMLHDHSRGNMIATIHLSDSGNLYYARDCNESNEGWTERVRVNGSTSTVSGDTRTCSARVRGRTGNSRTNTDYYEGNTSNFSGNTSAATRSDTGGIKNQSGESRPKNAYVNYIIKY